MTLVGYNCINCFFDKLLALTLVTNYTTKCCSNNNISIINSTNNNNNNRLMLQTLEKRPISGTNIAK